MPHQLEQIKQFSTVVADTGDIDMIKLFCPQDATTNPTLILAAAKKPDYRHLIDQAIQDHTGSKEHLVDHVLINFGIEILKHIPGRISTEVDPRLAFDYKQTVAKARFLIELYEKKGIPRERVLIKIPATWEGVRAAEVLRMEDIQCNMTLIFSLLQAAACAEVKTTLISPFVGRITDWHKKNEKVNSFPIEKDPGVLSLKTVYSYMKKFHFSTEVMGASFRSKEQVLALAGCDLLTISPALLKELQFSEEPVSCHLSTEEAEKTDLEKIHTNESSFRFLLNEDQMATEKLAEGIRLFARDYIALEQMIG